MGERKKTEKGGCKCVRVCVYEDVSIQSTIGPTARVRKKGRVKQGRKGLKETIGQIGRASCRERV